MYCIINKLNIAGADVIGNLTVANLAISFVNDNPNTVVISFKQDFAQLTSVEMQAISILNYTSIPSTNSVTFQYMITTNSINQANIVLSSLTTKLAGNNNIVVLPRLNSLPFSARVNGNVSITVDKTRSFSSALNRVFAGVVDTTTSDAMFISPWMNVITFVVLMLLVILLV